MHSVDYNYTDEDTRYADDPTTKLVSFNFNSDMSGEVIISNELSVIRVPGWMLLEFVGTFLNGETVSMLENMSGKETLGYLTGGAI